MFRVTEHLCLDGLQKLLPEGQAPPPGAPDPAQIRIVGQETGSLLLFAVVVPGAPVQQSTPDAPTDDSSPAVTPPPAVLARTFLDLFECKSRRFTQLYSVDEPLDVVWATCNKERSVIALTVTYKGPNDQPLYDTVIACIGESAPKSRPWLVTERSEQPQRIQFLFDVVVKTERTSHFVVLLGGERIVVVSACQTRKSSPLKVECTVVENYVWAQLNQRTNTLYYVARAGPKEKGAAQVLHCQSLVDRKQKTDFLLTSPICPQPFLFGESAPLPFAIGAPPQLVPLPFARVVCPDQKITCLCVQHDFVINTENGIPEPCIPITILVLSQKLRVDFDIPMRNVSLETLKGTRVIFDTMTEFLVIWVPGQFLHLLDFSESNPGVGMSLAGLEASPIPLPFAGVMEAPLNLDPIAYPLDLLDLAESRSSPLALGCILSAQTGIMYQYCFDRRFIMQMYETPHHDLHLQLLHTACIHMQDLELIHQVVMHILNRKPENATVAFFKEFIIGATYNAVRSAGAPQNVLSLLFPNNQDPDVAQLLKKKTSIEKSVVTPINYVGNSPSTTKKPVRDTRRSLSMSASRNSSGLYSPNMPHEEKGPLIGYIRSLFGSSNESVPTPEALETCKTVEDMQAAFLTAHLMDNLTSKEDRMRAPFFAQSFIKYRNEEVKALYQYIKQSFPDPNDTSDPRELRAAFQTLENLYCAMSELQIAPPSDFQLRFSQLAYDTLPQGVFLQYVDRGVIQITYELVCQLQKKGLAEQQPRYFYHLLCKLPVRSVVATLLRENKLPHFIVEHLLSTNPQLTMTSMNVDLASLEDSPFIPLSLLLKVFDANAPGGAASSDMVWAEVMAHAKDFKYMTENMLSPRSSAGI